METSINKLTYYNKKKIINILLTVSLVIALVNILGLISVEAQRMVNSILSIIIAFCAIIILNTSIVFRSKLISSTNLIFIVVIAFESINLIPNHMVKELILFSKVGGYERFNLFMTCYGLSWLHINTNIYNKNKYPKFPYLSCIALVIVLGLNQIFFSKIYILKITMLITYSFIYYLLPRKRSEDSNNVDYVRGSFLMIALCLLFNWQSTYKISYYFFTVFFIFSHICFVDNMVNYPYKTMFKNLFDRVEYRKKLNSNLKLRNSELEETKEIVKKKAELFKNLLRSIPMPLAILNKENNRIYFVNDAFIENIGHKSLKKIINKRLKDLMEIDGNIEEVEEDTIIKGSIDIEGNKRYYEIESIAGYGEVEESILIFYDVTTKAKVESMKKTVKGKILEERLKRDFLSNISHDLKTPINVIYSAAQLAGCMIEKKDVESLKKYNVISKRNCISLIRLANNLIDTSRIQSDYLLANFQVKNIVSIVEDSVDSLIDYAKINGVDLIFDTKEEVLLACIDENFMQRIMINLISNAIKYCGDKGVILVSIENIQDKIYLKVEDNGVGMEKEFVENAFNRYSVGENNEEVNAKGTGIGLFVVKRLMEIQMGEVFLESTKDVGTCFNLIFNKIGEDFNEECGF